MYILTAVMLPGVALSADGGWALAPVHRAAVQRLGDGSRPPTTALCLDALATYLAP